MKFTRAGIETCIDVLKQSAKRLGEEHSQYMQANGSQPTPMAYTATNVWYAAQIIESYLEMSDYYDPLLKRLREENYELKCQLLSLKSMTPDLGLPTS